MTKFHDMMTYDEVPPLPTREQEIDYMQFLEKSILTDPWITLRPKKHMAGPWRLRWKRKFEQRREYYKTFLKNFFATAVLATPLIFYLAKKRQYASSGVPMTRVFPTDLFTPIEHNKIGKDYLKNKYIRRTFRYGLFKYSFLIGFAGGYLFTDREFFNDDLNGRPDLSQFRSMLPGTVTDRERKVFDMYGDTYHGKQWDDTPQSWYKKLQKKLFPSVDYNPHSSHYEPFYDYKRGYYPSIDPSQYYSG